MPTFRTAVVPLPERILASISIDNFLSMLARQCLSKNQPPAGFVKNDHWGINLREVYTRKETNICLHQRKSTLLHTTMTTHTIIVTVKTIPIPMVMGMALTIIMKCQAIFLNGYWPPCIWGNLLMITIRAWLAPLTSPAVVAFGQLRFRLLG